MVLVLSIQLLIRPSRSRRSTSAQDKRYLSQYQSAWWSTTSLRERAGQRCHGSFASEYTTLRRSVSPQRRRWNQGVCLVVLSSGNSVDSIIFCYCVRSKISMGAHRGLHWPWNDRRMGMGAPENVRHLSKSQESACRN